VIRAIRVTLAIPPLVWGGIVNLFLIGNLLADGTRAIVLMNHLAPWITLISLIAFTLALIVRPPRRLLVWLVPGVIAFAWWYGAAWLPRSTPDVDGVEITATTYNVLGHLADPDQTFAVIRDMNADIVGLEELRPTLQGKLKTELSETYPYQLSKVVQGYDGLALLSRYPISEQTIDFDIDPDHSDLVAPKYIRAVLDVNGHAIVVYVIHPTIPTPNIYTVSFTRFLTEYDETYLYAHIKRTYDLVQSETLPVLLLCDCNTTPRSRGYRLLDGVLDEAFGTRGRGFGFTHPVDPFPLLRIDYVWYSRDFTALDAEVWKDTGTSDHHPLWARLVLRQAS
jgi:endonuclease/exonuclease/phosphatase (EEP) superfamily protein YafD